jgi:uncharacterized protein with LGFP repeats
VCRVATCVPPWQYDPSCTTTVRTDNRTVDHGAPCLTTDCGTPISKKYAALGGAGGKLGAMTQAEAAVGDGRGRRARYTNGNIYWTSTTGAWEVSGGRLNAYTAAGGPTAAIGYPTTDTTTSANGAWYYNKMENGRLYQRRSNGAAYYLVNPIFAKHEATGGIYGPLGAPTANQKKSSDGKSTYQNFAGGRIYVRSGAPTLAIVNPWFTWHEGQGGVHGKFGYPTSEIKAVGDARGTFMTFQNGYAYRTSALGIHGLTGPILLKYVADGGPKSAVKYPTSGVVAVGDGVGSKATFEAGGIWTHPSIGPFRVHGAVYTWYVARGGARGSLGYPISDLDPPGTAGGRFQRFQHGKIEYKSNGTVVQV